MSEPIGPGDWVECLEIEGETERAPNSYHVGELCIVSDVHDEDGWPSLNCVGKTRPEDWDLPFLGWTADAFRPIYRPKSEIIEALKQPTKVDA